MRDEGGVRVYVCEIPRVEEGVGDRRRERGE